jgi:hypothetical protein
LRYLKKTKNKGIIIKAQDRQFNLDLYCDADMAGLYGREDPSDPVSVKSRTGYIILLSGWPIVWKSQLQSCITLSTMEAETVALSSSLKIFLPLKWLTQEMIDKTKCHSIDNVRILATAFEDNQSAYYLVTNQRITSRTRYLQVRHLWFFEKYNQGEFTIVKCPTDKMQADYLTKGLAKEPFEANRMAVQGW